MSNIRLCRHNLPIRPGSEWDDGNMQCRICWLESVTHRRGVAKGFTVAPMPQLLNTLRPSSVKSLNVLPSPCRFRSEEEITGLERQKLGLEHSKKWYKCEKNVNNGYVCECNHCKTCDQRLPNDRFPVRNLLYHIYPIRGNGIWQWNIEQLKARLDLFTGKRIVAVIQNHVTDSMQSVIETFADSRIDEFIEIPNDPRLREVRSWEILWSRVNSLNADEITFYGHAKGVTRPFNPGSTIQNWIELLYESCLDFYPLVLKSLDVFPITGSMKKLGRAFQGSQSQWHYSGTFYWVRNRDFFLKNWQHIDQRWWGTESWPGIHFNQMEAGVLFGEGQISQLDCYDFVKFGRLHDEFQQWKQKHSVRRSSISCVTDS